MHEKRCGPFQNNYWLPLFTILEYHVHELSGTQVGPAPPPVPVPLFPLGPRHNNNPYRHAAMHASFSHWHLKALSTDNDSGEAAKHSQLTECYPPTRKLKSLRRMQKVEGYHWGSLSTGRYEKEGRASTVLATQAERHQKTQSHQQFQASFHFAHLESVIILDGYIRLWHLTRAGTPASYTIHREEQSSFHGHYVERL